jgi:ligand-binding sensor domain-containing protein
VPILLSLSSAAGRLWGAGPEGLYRIDNGQLQPAPQPQQFPACCLESEGRLLVGGAPLGVAFSLDEGETWQASWMDGVDARVVALAADPRVQETGVLLAGSEGGGVLRSWDRGRSWQAANVGLHNYHVLALAWAPQTPRGVWPAWEVVFAGAEDGVYRSPNGGRAWKRSAGVPGVVLGLAVAPDFHHSGMVLAGTEENGLWCSTDGGHCFDPVPSAPQQINALAVTGAAWFLSDSEALWRSTDGRRWERLPDSAPSLALLATEQGVLAAQEERVTLVA